MDIWTKKYKTNFQRQAAKPQRKTRSFVTTQPQKKIQPPIQLHILERSHVLLKEWFPFASLRLGVGRWFAFVLAKVTNG